jgi:hypothetical protein
MTNQDPPAAASRHDGGCQPRQQNAIDGADSLPPQDITDPGTGLSRLLAERCSTCILRPGDRMYLGPERTVEFVRQVLDQGTYVICHQTLTYGDYPDYGPAICRGFFDAYSSRSRALLLLRAFRRLTHVPPPAAPDAPVPGRTEEEPLR